VNLAQPRAALHGAHVVVRLEQRRALHGRLAQEQHAALLLAARPLAALAQQARAREGVDDVRRERVALVEAEGRGSRVDPDVNVVGALQTARRRADADGTRDAGLASA